MASMQDQEAKGQKGRKPGFLGQRILRKEDAALLTGNGRYADDLPELGYMILMDQIYLVAYALIVFTLVRAIYAYKAVSVIADENDARFKSVHKTDKLLFVAQILVFFAAVAAIVSLGAPS